MRFVEMVCPAIEGAVLSFLDEKPKHKRENGASQLLVALCGTRVGVAKRVCEEGPSPCPQVEVVFSASQSRKSASPGYRSITHLPEHVRSSSISSE